VIADSGLIEKAAEWPSLCALARIEAERYHKATGKTETEIRVRFRIDLLSARRFPWPGDAFCRFSLHSPPRRLCCARNWWATTSRQLQFALKLLFLTNCPEAERTAVTAVADGHC
jgi:hypothetical protein